MTLKVLSYTICEGGERRLPGIARLIREQRPDVAALQEATSHATAMSLARDLELDLVFGEANDGYHIAWMSRLPIHRRENHRLACLSKTLLEIEVAWEGVLLHLFATHLGARRDRHQPMEEVPTILEVLRPLASQEHLLLGDLNALRRDDPIGALPAGEQKRGDAVDGAPRQAIQQLVDAGYVDCYRTLHSQAPGYTYPSDAPWLRLDYIFASPLVATRLSACEVISEEASKQASDHLPIWAEFL